MSCLLDEAQHRKAYFEKPHPETFLHWRRLNARASRSLYLQCSTIVSRPHRLSLPRARGQLSIPSRFGGDPGFEKSRGRGDDTSTARQPCRDSGYLSCCFGWCGATPAPSGGKVGTERDRGGKGSKLTSIRSSAFSRWSCTTCQVCPTTSQIIRGISLTFGQARLNADYINGVCFFCLLALRNAINHTGVRFGQQLHLC